MAAIASSRRYRRMTTQDAMVTLDVTALNAMPVEELRRPASVKRVRPSAGGRRTKGRAAGAPGQGLRWEVARRECACFTRWRAHTFSLLPCARYVGASSARRGAAKVVMPASEHSRSQCVHGTQAGVKRGRLAQRAGGRRRCGSGQGLGAPHLASLDSFVGKSCAEQEKCKVPPKLNGS